jgi:outer membrane protein assembly factor BamB
LDGTIYIGSEDGNLYALTPDGGLLWQCSVGAPIWTSSPAIGLNGDIYIGSYWDGTLNAVSSSGEFLWSFQCENSLLHTWMSTPAVGDDGTIYIHCIGFKLYALDPEGQLLWSGVMASNAEATLIPSSPSISEYGILYVGSGSFHEGSLWAIDVDSGGPAPTAWPKFRGNLKNTGRRYTDY